VKPFVTPSHLDALRPPPGHPGFQVRRTGDTEAALFSPGLNQALRSKPVRLEVRTKRFRSTRPEAAAVTQMLSLLRAGSRPWNESKVRLCSDLTLPLLSSPSPSVRVQRTDYYSWLTTSLLSLQQVREHGNGSPLFDGWQALQLDGAVCSLDEPVFANTIGASVLALTRDGRLVYQVQTDHNLVNKSRIVPAASGSMDWNRDLDPADPTLQGLVVRGAARELREECGLPAAAVPHKAFLLTGYARLLHWGGHPEFFLVAAVDAGFGEVRPVGDERQFVEEHFPHPVGGRAAEAVASLDRLLAKRDASWSIQMDLAVRFLRDSIVANPAGWESFVRQGRAP
jgi:hypothetical protein